MNIKKSDYFVFLKFLLDLFIIPFVFIFSYIIKFKLGWISHYILNLPYGIIYHHAQIEPYLTGLVYVVLTWIITFYGVGVYNQHTGITADEDEFLSVVKGVSYSTFFISLFIYFYNLIPHSRYVVFYSWVFGIFFLSLGRWGINSWMYSLIKKGKWGENVVVIGAESIGQDVVEKIVIQPSLKYYYCGTLANDVPSVLHYNIRRSFKYLGRIDEYKAVIDRINPDIIFLTIPHMSSESLGSLLNWCNEKNIVLNIISDQTDFNASLLKMIDFDGLPFVSHGEFKPNLMALFLKRILDIIVSLLIILCFLPVFLVVALLIKCTSPQGPIFYLQERLGKNEIPFNMIKFRTMIHNAEQSGPVMVNESGDSRYIWGGKFLRKYSIDELPQFINVLCGDMSIVGPRPERPFFVKQFKETYPFYVLRHKAKVGITGWAQINGRSTLTRRPDHKARYDLYYIKNWSFLLDIKIILRTFVVVLKGEEAY